MLDSTEKDDFREILAAVEGVGTEFSESRRQNHAAERRTVSKRFVADSGNVFADDDLGQLFATAESVLAYRRNFFGNGEGRFGFTGSVDMKTG